MGKPTKAAIEKRAATIHLDDLIVGGKPVAGSGISEDDLNGGHPVDPDALKMRLAEQQLEAEYPVDPAE